MDIAVVGAGIAGLSCAWRLAGGRLGDDAVAPGARVTLFEAAPTAGGHTNTVDVTLDGTTHPVDTGFLVFNRKTYPQLLRLFETLGIEGAPSEMTFSARIEGGGMRPVEWAGTNLGTVFAQRRNLLSPAFWGMLSDLVRFNREATALASRPDGDAARETLGAFLDRRRFGRAFRDWYLLPMAAAIWSCSTASMAQFPVVTFVQFCANHGLLQVADRPPWYTVPGGARRYVERMLAQLPDVRLATPVRSVVRTGVGTGSQVMVRTDSGTTRFDHVVFACHSDQALALLDDADADEGAIVGAVRYQANRAVLHTDASVLPSRRNAWAAWNYQHDLDARTDDGRSVCVHYLLNALQALPFERPVIVSLNPLTEPAAAQVVAAFDYAHPLFDAPAIAAQKRLPALQGRGHVWWCGAWTGYGFHEDGLRSGLAVADALIARHNRRDAEVRLAA